jgi:hypothetical protein
MIRNSQQKSLPKSWLIIIHVLAAAVTGYAIPWTLSENPTTNFFTIYLPALAAIFIAVTAAIQTFRGDKSWFLWTILSAIALFLNFLNSTLLYLAGIPLIPKILLFLAFVATIFGAIFGRKKPLFSPDDLANWNDEEPKETWG